MPKNIVLLSDGTGNSASAVWRTNVWRLYEALDLAREDQIAFYDDGVGTSSFKPLALLGSAFGWGLKRNVVHLYAFLCRNYEPLDRIYCFGFSRGAFTIRVVVALVTAIGLVNRAGMSDADLKRAARDVYRQYRRSGRFRPNYLAVYIFRAVRDAAVGLGRWASSWIFARKAPAPLNILGQPPIRFLGLWDTVAAYGLPMDEMTRGVDLYFWPMSMRDRELSNLVERACHALALDDERTTFHPLLWNEARETDVFVGAANITRVDQERISQVWFAGMHANVGGGYPDDGMAHVPLDWIMGEAENCGLGFKRTSVSRTMPDGGIRPTRFFASVRETLRATGDACGRIYDSRRGLAGYYRYGPRRVADLRNDNYKKVFIQLPKIHESVFERVKHGVGSYAPFVVPAEYAVVRRDGTILHGADNLYEHPTQSLSRYHRAENVWNWVWGRRIVFFLTFLATLYVALSPWKDKIVDFVYTKRIPWIETVVTRSAELVALPLHAAASLTEVLPSASTIMPERVGGWLQKLGAGFSHLADVVIPPILKVAAGLLPGFVAPWLEGYQQHPTWTAAWAVVIGLLIYTGARIETRIDATMRAIWVQILATGPQTVNPDPEPGNPLYLVRTSWPYRWFIIGMKYYVLPTLFALSFLIAGIAALGALWLALFG